MSIAVSMQNCKLPTRINFGTVRQEGPPQSATAYSFERYAQY